MLRSIGPEALLYPTPVVLVGCYDTHGTAAFMTAGWCGICCSDPPMIAVSIRPERATHDHVLARKAFTVNIPSTRFIAQVDACGMLSSRDGDKNSYTGLQVTPSNLVDAPCAADMPVVLELRLHHVLPLGLHTQFIGQVVDTKVQEQCMGRRYPSLEAIDPLLYSPGDRLYYKIGAYLGKAYSVGKPFLPPKR